MKLSRDYVLRELRAMEALVHQWADEIETPMAMKDGEEVPIFLRGVPEGMPMDELQLPVDQFRAEMAGLAGRIEALITAG